MRERFLGIQSYKAVSRYIDLEPDELAFVSDRLANPDVIESGLAAIVETGWRKHGQDFIRTARLKVADEITKDAWISELDTYKTSEKRKE